LAIATEEQRILKDVKVEVSTIVQQANVPYPIGSFSPDRKFLTPVIENWNTDEGFQCQVKMSTFSSEQSWIYGTGFNLVQAKEEGRKLSKIMNLFSVYKLTVGSCEIFRFLSCCKLRSYTKANVVDAIRLVPIAFCVCSV
jgi:hypothetical protein